MSHLLNTFTFISDIILQIKFFFTQINCLCIIIMIRIENIDLIPPINNKTFAFWWHQLINQQEVWSQTRMTGDPKKGSTLLFDDHYLDTLMFDDHDFDYSKSAGNHFFCVDLCLLRFIAWCDKSHFGKTIDASKQIHKFALKKLLVF